MERHYDLVVVGSGPAGHHAAIQAVKLGKHVAVVEKKQMVGGVCVNTGTIPSKTMREAVLHLTGFRQRSFYGSSYSVKENITAEDLRLRTHQVINLETDVFLKQFRRNHIDIIHGFASFLDSHRIAVEGLSVHEEITADFIVIATGTSPARPAGIPFDDTSIVNSDTFLQIPALPHSITIVGAGVIGVEYACMTAALGIPTTVVEKREGMLEFVDDEIVECLRFHMREMGVAFRFGEEVAGINKTPEGRVIAKLESQKVIQSDALLYCVGRQGNTEGLNLEKAGLEADNRGRISVNECYRTRVPHILAAGDVVGFPSLASVSMEQGRLASCYAYAAPVSSMPHLFPYGIYTIPEISYVGSNEKQLTEKGIPYEVGVARYREIARGNIMGDQHGMLKLLFNRENYQLLGVHIIGEGAAELVHIGQAVLAFEGSLNYFLQSVFNYPTLAECYKVAALEGSNKISPNPTAVALH
jgi:NAD(P) transhydrogenase